MKGIIEELEEALEIENENLSIYEGREDVNSDFHNTKGLIEALEYALRIIKTQKQ